MDRDLTLGEIRESQKGPPYSWPSRAVDSGPGNWVEWVGESPGDGERYDPNAKAHNDTELHSEMVMVAGFVRCAFYHTKNLNIACMHVCVCAGEITQDKGTVV